MSNPRFLLQETEYFVQEWSLRAGAMSVQWTKRWEEAKRYSTSEEAARTVQEMRDHTPYRPTVRPEFLEVSP